MTMLYYFCKDILTESFYNRKAINTITASTYRIMRFFFDRDKSVY